MGRDVSLSGYVCVRARLPVRVCAHLHNSDERRQVDEGRRRLRGAMDRLRAADGVFGEGTRLQPPGGGTT